MKVYDRLQCESIQFSRISKNGKYAHFEVTVKARDQSENSVRARRMTIPYCRPVGELKWIGPVNDRKGPPSQEFMQGVFQRVMRDTPQEFDPSKEQVMACIRPIDPVFYQIIRNTLAHAEYLRKKGKACGLELPSCKFERMLQEFYTEDAVKDLKNFLDCVNEEGMNRAREIWTERDAKAEAEAKDKAAAQAEQEQMLKDGPTPDFGLPDSDFQFGRRYDHWAVVRHKPTGREYISQTFPTFKGNLVNARMKLERLLLQSGAALNFESKRYADPNQKCMQSIALEIMAGIWEDTARNGYTTASTTPEQPPLTYAKVLETARTLKRAVEEAEEREFKESMVRCPSLLNGFDLYLGTGLDRQEAKMRLFGHLYGQKPSIRIFPTLAATVPQSYQDEFLKSSEVFIKKTATVGLSDRTLAVTLSLITPPDPVEELFRIYAGAKKTTDDTLTALSVARQTVVDQGELAKQAVAEPVWKILADEFKEIRAELGVNIGYNPKYSYWKADFPTGFWVIAHQSSDGTDDCFQYSGPFSKHAPGMQRVRQHLSRCVKAGRRFGAPPRPKQ